MFKLSNPPSAALLILLALIPVRAEGDAIFCKDAAQEKGDKEAFSLYDDSDGWWGFKELTDVTVGSPKVTFKTIHGIPSAIKCVDECQKLGVDRVDQDEIFCDGVQYFPGHKECQLQSGIMMKVEPLASNATFVMDNVIRGRCAEQEQKNDADFKIYPGVKCCEVWY